MNWSGGKDATLALYYTLQQKSYDVTHLFTTISNPQNRITMHGVRAELLELQAQSIGISLRKMQLPNSNSMEVYNQLMQQEMAFFTRQKISTAIFGDIYLEDLRQYRETQLQKIGMKGVFPLWKKPTKQIIKTFIDLGFKAITVCVNAKHLDESYVGRLIDDDFINSLPPEVDICGENGEFHTFVYDGPLFNSPVPFRLGKKVYKDYSNGKPTNYDTGFHFIDLEYV